MTGILTGGYPAWESKVTDSGTKLTAEMIARMKAEMIAYRPAVPQMLILPGPVFGNDQRSRRRRRVRTSSGAILELPSGTNPVIYVLTGGSQWR